MGSHMKSSGEGDEEHYPGELATRRKTRTGLELFLRPIKVTDEPLLRDLLHGLSDRSLYCRFFTKWREMLEGQLPGLARVDYRRTMAVAAVVMKDGTPGKEKFVGVGRYEIDPGQKTAVVALAVRDAYQGRGIGQVLLEYLTELARRRGLIGFTAVVLADNEAMLRVFAKGGFETRKEMIGCMGVETLVMMFRPVETGGSGRPRESKPHPGREGVAWISG